MKPNKPTNSNFLDKLKFFENYATNRQNDNKKPEKIKYVVDISKTNKKIEEMQKQGEQQRLKRLKTVTYLPGQYNTNNVKKMTNNIINIEKQKKDNKEKLMKEIHEKKNVDNSAIKKRTEKIIEERKKENEEKINQISKKYENNINYNYDVKSKIEAITIKTPSPEKIQPIKYNPVYNNTFSSKLNYNKEVATKNIQNNQKLQTQIDNNINKIFGEQAKEKNLTFEQKYHLFDRKIKNYEDKEKLKLSVIIKNPNSEYEYESKVYDENKNLIAQSDKKSGEKEIILYNNLIVDYIFTKKTSYSYEIIKSILEGAIIKSEMEITLNDIISSKENLNYEKKIENLMIMK